MPDAPLESEQEAEAVTSLDGTRYGVMLGTDVRGLWYRSDLLEQAGVPLPWEPSTWDEVLDTARAVRAEHGEDVVPLNVYAGTPAGEVAFFQLSGGSTGTPKLIPRTHDDYAYSVRESVRLCGVTAQTRFLCPAACSC